MKNILGFNAFIHDTAAALVTDGGLKAFCEEERLNRIKHTTLFPKESIESVLTLGGITLRDLDGVAFYWDPSYGFTERILLTLKNMPGSLRQIFRLQAANFYHMNRAESLFRKAFDYRGPFRYVNHYLSHAAGAFYPSPFDEALILIIDGNGEIATTWFGIGEGKRITPLGEIHYPHSLGLLYCTITEYLGYRQNSDEGKVMGLSAYGSDRFLPAFRKIVHVGEDGRFSIDLSYFDYHQSRSSWFSQKFVREFGPPRKSNEPIAEHHKDVAYACQTVLEESVIKMLGILTGKTGKKKLAFSGGVALNCVLNGKLLSSGLIDDLYVPPPAYDAGAAWGAALYAAYEANPGLPRTQTHSPYFGPTYSSSEMKAALEQFGLCVSEPNDLAHAAASLLSEGLIVGWFQGRMEMGPRALGHRSILADPRPPTMKDHVNERVKHREPFRPFGPSVLLEEADKLFTTGGRASPYMLEAFNVRDEWKNKIPAITHVDGTARIQTVSKDDDLLYYQLIESFNRITGVPAVLNTSFNVMGQPIVNTPIQAVECFMSTGIDALVLGPYLTVKGR